MDVVNTVGQLIKDYKSRIYNLQEQLKQELNYIKNSQITSSENNRKNILLKL